MSDQDQVQPQTQPSVEEQILATLVQMNTLLRAIQRDMADSAQSTREMKTSLETHLRALDTASRLPGT